MKNNPLTDLVFESTQMSSGFGFICEVRLIHKSLPFKIVRRCEYDDKYFRSFPEKIKEAVDKTIRLLFLAIYQIADNNVPMQPVGGVFTPVWDNEQLQWFVLNYKGEKLYTWES